MLDMDRLVVFSYEEIFASMNVFSVYYGLLRDQVYGHILLVV